MTAISILAAAEEDIDSLATIFLGPEQYLCYLAFLIAVWILMRGRHAAIRESIAASGTMLSLPAGHIVGRADARGHILGLGDPGHPLSKRSAGALLRHALLQFEAGASIQEVLQGLHQDVESIAARMDARLGFVRYLLWAIPSLGFVGTVRGMGNALAAADLSVGVDTMMKNVVGNLGTAFYTTLVALLLSLALMWIFHAVQQRQEELALDLEQAVRQELVRCLRADD